MAKLTIILDQQTPLLHFQADQEGRCLRASEVKPRLHKYLGLDDSIRNQYQMSIEGIGDGTVNTERSPMYFGGNDKSQVLYKQCKLTILSSNKGIIDSFKNKKDAIIQFFLTHNFGTRQTKGYGSFTLYEFDGKTIEPSILPEGYVSLFTSRLTKEPNGIKQLFQEIELLHKTLRSGINGNGRKGNSLYFKSLMFQYAQWINNNLKNSSGLSWDKAEIKKHFLSEKIKKKVEENREATIRDNGISWKSLPGNSNPETKEYYKDLWWPKDRDNIALSSSPADFRDYLGLSTAETWMAYDTGRFPMDNNNRPRIKKDGNERYKLEKMTVKKAFDKKAFDEGFANSVRFKSPLLYKPVWDEKGKKWTVYIIDASQTEDVDLCKALSEKTVWYKSNMPGAETFSLNPISGFSLKEYLFFAFDKGQEVVRYFENKEKDEARFKRIVDMYAELKKNLTK